MAIKNMSTVREYTLQACQLLEILELLIHFNVIYRYLNLPRLYHDILCHEI